MDLKPLIVKNKNKVLNLVIMLFAGYLAFTIYQGQNAKVVNLANNKEIEIKKNEIITEISQQQGVFNSYKSLFNTKESSQLADAISSLAATGSVKIVSFRPVAEENYPVYSRYPFEIKIEANDYHSLGKFISSLESHQYFFDVESIKITPQPPEKGRVRLNADLRISSLLIKD